LQLLGRAADGGPVRSHASIERIAMGGVVCSAVRPGPLAMFPRFPCHRNLRPAPPCGKSRRANLGAGEKFPADALDVICQVTRFDPAILVGRFPPKCVLGALLTIGKLRQSLLGVG
jgi:hypothetical protein